MAGSKVPRDENMTPEVRRFLDDLSRNATATMPTSTVKGNVSGAADTPSDLTTTELTTLVNAFTAALKGAVPAPVSATGKFLRDDGTWAAAGALTQSFTSSQQTITSAGSLTIAHGLSTTPTLLQLSLLNQTAELGYSIADTLFIAPPQLTTVNNQGVSVVPDATNLNIRFGSAGTVFAIINKTTGVVSNITAANWKIVFSCWA